MPWADLPEATRTLVWEGEPGGRQNWKRRWYGLRGFFEWLEARTYRMHVRVLLSRYRRYLPCAACGGSRLKPEALLFRVAGRTLPDLEALPIAEVEAFFRQHRPAASDAATDLLLGEVRGRLRFLVDVGLGYLTLARQSRTLSGGEAQRVSLATALGSSLTSTLYVLDEPSVGLHARDAGKLSGVLGKLAQAGNAVVVVEHDPALIAAADHVIDLGPGPGREGGEVVYQGPLPGLLAEPRSRTGAFLAGKLQTNPRARAAARRAPAARLRVRGARENNLKDVTVDLPLGRLVCVTGVSGSGKSTLVDQILYRNLRRALGHGESEPGQCEGLAGAEAIGDVVLVDQSPLGASSRVNAATYLGVLDPLRAAFAATPEAKEAELTASAFSFNSAAGACPTCNGAGYEKIELQFLPDAYVRCPACDGRRFRPEVLEIRCRGYDIAALLDLPAAEVARLFADNRRVVRALQPLLDIGLRLPVAVAAGAHPVGRRGAAAEAGRAPGGGGQTARVSSTSWTSRPPGCTPRTWRCCWGRCTGWSTRGNSVVVVEHNLEVARAADWIIDLGPEGGDGGGQVVGEGTPEAIARLDTRTGRALRAEADRRGGGAGQRQAAAGRRRRRRARSGCWGRARTTCATSRSRCRATSWWRSRG